MPVLNFITDNILRNPPILLGLIALLGLIIQRKPVADVVKGALTAAFGMVILQAGVAMLVGAIAPINTAVQSELGVTVATASRTSRSPRTTAATSAWPCSSA